MPPHPESRVDLHLHTTHSDGEYSPADVVSLGVRAGLPALAVTDHDTLDGSLLARELAGARIEIVPGVEITAEFQGREFHLLAYFVDPGNAPLLAALTELRERRRQRFRDMVESLRGRGVALPAAAVDSALGGSVVGRAHLAELLVAGRHVASRRQAFSRYLGDDGGIAIPGLRLPVARAIELVRGAGGVAACAHPRYDCTRDTLAELRGLGLRAVEVDFPNLRNNRQRELRRWAEELGLAVTGGSDCHGPGDHRRAIGTRGVTWKELEALRRLAAT